MGQTLRAGHGNGVLFRGGGETQSVSSDPGVLRRKIPGTNMVEYLITSNIIGVLGNPVFFFYREGGGVGRWWHIGT